MDFCAWVAAVAIVVLMFPGMVAAQGTVGKSELRTPDVPIYGSEPRRTAVEITQDPQAAPASVTVIDKRQLDRQTITTYGDMFRPVPGMWVVEYGQGNVAYGLSMRGFTSAEHGRDIAVFLDGMPLNVNGSQHTNGYVDLAQVIPELISRVEVTRGPFSPFVGNNAVAGSVQLYTDANPVSSVRASVDNFGRARVVPILATDAGPGRLVVAAEASYGSAYTDNSRAQRLNLFTRYVFPMLGGLGAVRLQAYEGAADAPGYLNRDAIRSGLFSDRTALSDAIGDNKAQQNLVFNYRSDDLEGRAGGGWFATAYVNSDERTRWTGSSTDQLPTNPVTIRAENDRMLQWGGDVRKVTSFDTAGLPSQVTAGASYNSEDLQGNRFLSNSNRDNVSQIRDRHIISTTLAAYGQYQIKPVERLKATLGLRYDQFRYDLTRGPADDAQPPLNVSTSNDIVSPKFGVALEVYRSADQQAEVFANVARGFKTPWPWDDFFTNPYRSASPLVSYEVGVQGGAVNNALFWRTSVWQTKQTREVFTNPATGITTDFGETQRRGLDLETQYQVTESTRVLGNYSWIDAKSLSAPPGFDAISNVPQYVAGLGVQSLRVSGPHRWDLSLFDVIVGPQPLDPTRTLVSGSYQRITGRVSYGHANWGGTTVILTLIAIPGSGRNLNETSFDFGGFAASAAQAPWRAIASINVPF